MNAFELGATSTLEKIASNPAQAVKLSLPGPKRQEGPPAAYLNQGGGKAGKQTAGCIEKKPTPGKDPLAPTDSLGGEVSGRGGAPDTGEKGTSGGDMKLTKAAELGMQSVFEA